MDPDEVIVSAVVAAAGAPIYRPTKYLERDLVAAVADQLSASPAVSNTVKEERYELSTWSHSPGGVDLAVYWSDGSGRIVCEMKVGKPGESIWDAIKLADIQHHEPKVLGGYLISDAHWQAGADAAALFSEADPFELTCAEMICRWPAAWKNLLIGGHGIRPRCSVGGVRFTRLRSVEAVCHPGRELVVVRVDPLVGVPPQSYDRDGWPDGYEPPDRHREVARAADDLLTRSLAVAPAPRYDACHGFPWYDRWSQPRLDALVPVLDEGAYACLRKRLARERGWTEAELSERVDPLRGPGPSRGR